MTGGELLALISKALLSGAVTALSKRTTEGILEWFSEQAKSDGRFLSEKDKVFLKDLPSDDASFWKTMAAQFKLVERKGICLIGPSGVGKTALFNALSGASLVKPRESTSRRRNVAVRYGTRYIRLTDTPGSVYHVDIEKHTYDIIRAGKIKILMLVLGYGYLETVGAPPLSRPSLDKKQHASLPGYLSATRSEEIKWAREAAKFIPKVKNKIQYLMVVLNKLDLWIDRFSQTIELYTHGPIYEEILKIASHWCRTDIKASFHPVSTIYDSFYGKPPSGKMSAEASSLSVQLLRAQIRLRLLED